MEIVIALVVCTAIVCATVYALVVHQRKPPPHIHRWWTEGVQVIRVFDNTSWSNLPVGHKSHFSQACEGCGEKRIVIKNGRWKSDLEKTG